MNKGFMFLHRQLLDWEWFDNSQMVHVWIYLLLKANYQEDNWHGIQVPRGSFITSIGNISKDTGLSARTVRTCINRLKSTGEVTIKSTNKYSVVTICKYDNYNIQNAFTDEPTTNKTTSNQTNKRQTNDIQTTTSNNINKEIKEEEKETKVSKKKEIVYSDEFESDWVLYGRKGSKVNGYKRWKELTEEDKIKMRLHIPYYLQSNERQYLKDFEGYINQRLFESPVYQGSTLLYDPMQSEQPEGYHPLTDNCQIWDEKNQCLRIFNGDIDNLNDGYTDENRPDGATVSWGMYSWKWDKSKKEWI